MRLLFTILVFSLILAFCASPVFALPAMELRLETGGLIRRALLVNEAPERETRPVVIVLHGGGGSAEQMRRRAGFDELAVTQGFSVVYAEGVAWAPGRHAWNTGYLSPRQSGRADDIAYLDALIDLLIARHRADPSRVYMTGGSNGAMMVFVYAVARSERLAAIAPVVGAMFSFASAPRNPVPILMINGARDDEVPLEGGMSRNPLVASAQAAPYQSWEDTVGFWVSVNRAGSRPSVEIAENVTTRTHAAGPDGAIVISVIDAAGGHGWPGSSSGRRDNTPIQSFRGAERVWDFFRTQRRAD
jgi:polyhydroxybutyrate depolymerase